MSNRPAVDIAAEHYDPAGDGYDITKDPRCLWGWGPPTAGCHHRFGHVCFRAVGHAGACTDKPWGERAWTRCEMVRRPTKWDSVGRLEGAR